MEATLYRHDVTLANRVRAGAQRHDRRTRLYLVLRDGALHGVGEIAPQPSFLNGDPGVGDVLEELEAIVLPQLFATRAREGSLASWTRWGRLLGPRPASASAVALVEMAVLNLELQREARSLEQSWPATHELELQRVVSLLDRDDDWPDVRDVVRLRAKVAPGRIDDAALERVASAGLPVILDFNATAANASEVMDVVERVARVLDVVALEQPFRVGNLVDSAALAQQSGILVAIDEGVRSLRDVEQIVRYDAAQMICVKPARVGGLANARTLIATARTRGLRVYVGGFFESGYGRRVNQILARHCDVEASDVGPITVVEETIALVEQSTGFGLAVLEGTLERLATRLSQHSSET